MYDFIICGCGFAGAISANILATKYNKKVLILEKRPHIAGNCYDFKDKNNILIHKYGPHLFHTSSKIVWDFISNFSNWTQYEHKVLAHIDGQNTPIPFNFNSINKLFDENLAQTLIDKLLQNYQLDSKVPILELKNNPDKDLQFLADFIYEKVFVNYTAKQWGIKIEELDNAVTARVPVYIGEDDRYFNDTFQAVPTDGYTKLFENLLKNENIEVECNIDFHTVCAINNNTIYYNNTPFQGEIIYTGMIDELFDYQYGELGYRSVDMQFETIEKEFFQECATVNFPNEHNYTRITEFKHIHQVNTPKTTILKEYPQNYKSKENTPYYPIFTEKNQNIYLSYQQKAKEIDNLLLLGRLAEYKYYDMDDIIEKVLTHFEKKL